MDPAMPDWRAFGEPVAAATAEPTRPDGRGPRGRAPFSELLARVPRSTLITIIAAGVLAVAGLGLALTTPSGGDVALVGAQEGPADGPVSGAARSLVTGRASHIVASGPDVVVDVAGAVARPGLVRLPAGSRIGDAILASGGYAPTADLDAAAVALNLAEPLTDGTKVLVPSLGASAAEAAPAGVDAGSTASGGRMDLNAATSAELEDLPGIGPVTAGRIVEARAQAPFSSVDELRSRGLVGESTFGKLRDLVTVGP